jgi:hypothetical protein
MLCASPSSLSALLRTMIAAGANCRRMRSSTAERRSRHSRTVKMQHSQIAACVTTRCSAVRVAAFVPKRIFAFMTSTESVRR